MMASVMSDPLVILYSVAFYLGSQLRVCACLDSFLTDLPDCPKVWNSLPPEIKTTSLTLGQFSGHRLKTEMFLCSYYASVQPS